jgi:hypothetical protein
VNLVLFKEPDVIVIDQGTVRLDVVGPVLLEAPGPERLEIRLRHDQRLTAEERERTALELNSLLHPIEVVRTQLIASVANRILVTVLTLNVAGYAERSNFNAHGWSLPRLNYLTRRGASARACFPG